MIIWKIQGMILQVFLIIAINFVMSKNLAKSCKELLKEAKREEEQKKQTKKPRKTIQDEIKEVKRQKISLEA